MHRFQVLPTDERYTKLTDRQKQLLLASFLEQPTEAELRQYYREEKHRETETTLSPEEEEQMRKNGYSQEQIERIKENLRYEENAER